MNRKCKGIFKRYMRTALSLTMRGVTFEHIPHALSTSTRLIYNTTRECVVIWVQASSVDSGLERVQLMRNRGNKRTAKQGLVLTRTLEEARATGDDELLNAIIVFSRYACALTSRVHSTHEKLINYMEEKLK